MFLQAGAQSCPGIETRSSGAADAPLILYDRPVAQPLAVALAMIVFNKFVDGLP
jgi:hypothetical protein